MHVMRGQVCGGKLCSLFWKGLPEIRLWEAFDSIL